MGSQDDNVILFPKWQKKLENASKDAMKDMRFDDALHHLEQLIEHDIKSHEVCIGKIICLMELGEFDEAESFCQELIALKDEHYYDYIHMYTTLLFQASFYDDLVELLEDKFDADDIPHPIKTQLWQVYEISKKLSLESKQEESSRYLNELKSAVKKGDPERQWRIVKKCTSFNATPFIDYLRNLLENEVIHPVVKTAILEWLQEQKIDSAFIITKFGSEITVHPSELSSILTHPSMIGVKEVLGEVEQNNPSLFELIEKLLYRYMYIRYPMMPKEKEWATISKAVTILGYSYLQLQTGTDHHEGSVDVDKYINEITSSEQLYFSIIEE